MELCEPVPLPPLLLELFLAWFLVAVTDPVNKASSSLISTPAESKTSCILFGSVWVLLPTDLLLLVPLLLLSLLLLLLLLLLLPVLLFFLLVVEADNDDDVVVVGFLFWFGRVDGLVVGVAEELLLAVAGVVVVVLVLVLVLVVGALAAFVVSSCFILVFLSFEGIITKYFQKPATISGNLLLYDNIK